jgi:hypothetical protein
MLRLVQPNEEPPEPDGDLDFLKDSEEQVNGLRTVLHRPVKRVDPESLVDSFFASNAE